MKAIGARQYHPVTHPDFLVEFETETPVPGPHELLVKIHAVSINPVDTKVRKLLGDTLQTPPKILGFDAASTVEAIGSEVTGFAPGDEIFHAGEITRPGSNAEYQLVDHRIAAKKPASFSFAEAAALPLVGITAYNLLESMAGSAGPATGKNTAILIINGAGGVGSALIPLARFAGLTVIATASRPETIAWCKSLGARHILDHHQPLRPQAEALGLSEFPFIANLHDTEKYWEQTADLLAPRGSLGLIVETRDPIHIGNPFRLKSPRIVWEYMFTRSKFQTADLHRQGEILQRIANAAESGHFPKITTSILSGLTVENLREAHAAMENHAAHGKWVLNR